MYAARPTAWTLSLAAHGALLLAIAFAMRGGHDHAPPRPPARLVYVKPVPPPAGALSRGDIVGAPQPLRAAEEARREPAPHPRADAEQPVPRLAAAARPRSARPRERPLPAPRAEPQPPPADTPVADAAPDGAAEGTHGEPPGVALGSTQGVEHGVVGGLGDAPLALRDVAAPPEIVDRVLPEYPARARAMQIEGQVLLEVILDRRGRVEENVRVTRSVPALDAAAVAAVRQWRFRPARDRDGRAVRVVMEIPVRFVLR